MQAKSIHVKSIEELKEVLPKNISDGFTPTLALIFTSIYQDRKAISTLLTEQGIDVVGATSSGEFIDGHQSQGETVILLIDIHKDDYTIIFRKTSGKEIEEVVREVASIANRQFDNPGYIAMTTCLNEKGELFEGAKLVQGLEKYTNGETDIFGGMAGADGQLIPSWVFAGSQSTDDGFVLLALNKDRIDLRGIAISGWKPLGNVKTVTRCEEGWLYAIDDQPALEMYLRYLGESIEVNEENSKSFVDDISIFHPFLCLDGIDPALRTPMFVDKKKNAIMLDFPIPAGGKLQFTMPPDFNIVESVLNEAETIKRGASNDADALIVFSCLGRLNALGPMATEENEGLHSIWNAPMAGFFTYGEYGKDSKGRNSIHSTTCSWVALKEK